MKFGKGCQFGGFYTKSGTTMKALLRLRLFACEGTGAKAVGLQS